MQHKEVTSGQWKELSNYLSENSFIHYSFDFWNTIAFSNPKFKNERTEFIFDYFGKTYDKALINNAFFATGRDYNLSLEKNGQTTTIDELYFRVFDYIGVEKSYDLEVIKSVIFKLFLDEPPSISEHFIQLLGLINRDEVSLSITSNTAFIPGSIIEKFLKQIGLLENFSFCVFSDIVQIAKPNPKIFDLVLNLLNRRVQSTNDVIHIGDNYQVDYLGAKYFGLSAFYVEKDNILTNSRHALHIMEEVDSIPFSALEYSKFKFGDSHFAEKYGKELFEYFKEFHLPTLLGKHYDFLIYSSPYAEIPTSSYYLTQTFYTAFSDFLHENQFKNVSAKFCKIRRCQTYTEDYGALSSEERYNLIKNDTYEFVDIPSIDAICIFIDDISITGTHQRIVEKLLEANSISTKSVFLYYAKLSNPEVCPSFENYLNYFFISDVNKLTEVVLADSYKITTRTTKYILSLNSSDLMCLIDKIMVHEKFSILDELVSMSYANKYNKIELYKQNLKTLEQYISKVNTDSVKLIPKHTWNN